VKAWLSTHGYQAKNNVYDIAGQENDYRDCVVRLNLVVSKKAANLAVPRQREPESYGAHDKKDHTNEEIHNSHTMRSAEAIRGISRSTP
jgi:hypothetical protein